MALLRFYMQKNASLILVLLAIALSFMFMGMSACETGDDDNPSRNSGDDDDNDTGPDDDDDNDTGPDDDDDDSIDPGAIVDNTGNAGKHTSLELLAHSGDNPRIAYYHEADGLKYAQWVDGSWDLGVVDGSSDEIGLYPSLRLDGTGNAHIAYYDKTNGLLRYVSGSPANGWSPGTVDGGTSDVGRYASLSLAGDAPAILYYDATGGDLKYARKSGGTWNIQVVDSEGDVGLFCSLDHDSTGNKAYAAYYDATGGDLKVAVKDGSWTVSSIDQEGDVGKWTSIKTDTIGNIHIAYFDEGGKNLKYARHLDGSTGYSVEMVETSGWTGANARMMLDANLQPRIIYHDQDFNDIKLAKRDGSEWDISNLVSDGPYGFGLSLEIDANGNNVVSHYHPLEGAALIHPPRDVTK